MELRTGFQGKLQIALRDRILGAAVHAFHAEFLGNSALVDNAAVDDCQILAVRDDRQSGFLCLCQRCFHELCGRDGSAVIGQRRDARGFQCFVIGKAFALQSDGQCACLMHVHTGILCAAQKIAHLLRIVHRRVGVRHTEHAGHAACQRRCAAGIDIFFMRLSGVAEMHMHIKQSGQDNQPRAVNHAVCLCCDILPDSGDSAVPDEDIADCVPQAVNRADIADEYGLQRNQPPFYIVLRSASAGGITCQMPSHSISFSSLILIWIRCPAK